MNPIYRITNFVIMLLVVFFSQTGYAQPTAAFNYDFNGGLSNACVPVTITLSNNSSSDATTFRWSVDGQQFSTEENPIRSVTTGGTYNICLEVSNAGGQTDQHCENITLFDPPVLSLTATPTIGCAPLDVAFTISSTVEMDSLIIDYGDGLIDLLPVSGTSFVQNHVYTTIGNFSVTITVYDENGCASTLSQVQSD